MGPQACTRAPQQLLHQTVPTDSSAKLAGGAASCRLTLQDFARQQQQYQQYQGHYPGYGYPPYAPPPKSGGGIPAFLWIALGAGAALAINKVREAKHC